MNARTPCSRGFTLVELLVVIAILALLMAMLVPTMNQAKELARLSVCATNFRNTGQAFHGYAAIREGRFPNKAAAANIEDRWYMTADGNFSDSGPWCPCWPNIINREYFMSGNPQCFPSPSDRRKDEPTCGPIIRFWTFWSPDYYKPQYLSKRYMQCPNYKPWGTPPGISNNWTRPWIANRMATGGVDWEFYNGEWGVETWQMFPGELGKRVSTPKAYGPYYTDYALGTRLAAFGDPGYTILLWETGWASDVSHFGSDQPNGGRITLNDDYQRPPWCGLNGAFAFRHVLPADQDMYQEKAQANVLFVDGHVEEVGTATPLALAKRFMPALGN